MKKIIVSLFLILMLFGGSVANAQTASQSEIIALQEQYQALITQLIQLLTQRIAELQAQIVALQAQPPVAVPPAQVTPIDTTPSPISEPIPMSNAPVLQEISVPTIKPEEYNPQVSMLIVNVDELQWSVNGGREQFACKLNGRDVPQAGRVIIVDPSNPNNSFTIVCVGNKTGIKIQNSL